MGIHSMDSQGSRRDILDNQDSPRRDCHSRDVRTVVVESLDKRSAVAVQDNQDSQGTVVPVYPAVLVDTAVSIANTPVPVPIVLAPAVGMLTVGQEDAVEFLDERLAVPKHAHGNSALHDDPLSMIPRGWGVLAVYALHLYRPAFYLKCFLSVVAPAYWGRVAALCIRNPRFF